MSVPLGGATGGTYEAYSANGMSPTSGQVALGTGLGAVGAAGGDAFRGSDAMPTPGTAAGFGTAVSTGGGTAISGLPGRKDCG